MMGNSRHNSKKLANKKAKNERLTSSERLTISEALLSVSTGFTCGLLLLSSALLMFSSTIIRILVIIGILSRSAYQKKPSSARKIFQAVEFSLVQLGGSEFGEELISHLYNQIKKWDDSDINYSKLHSKLMIFSLMGELLWAALIVRLESLFLRHRIY